MMSMGTAACPGKPGRITALQRFLTISRAQQQQVWICRRIDLARHWKAAFRTVNL